MPATLQAGHPAAIALLATVLLACGGSDEATATEGGAGPPDARCAALVDALAPSIGSPGACTALVRVVRDTKAPLDFALTCGAKATVTEAVARAAAQKEAGFGAEGELVAPPWRGEPDEYVFYKAPLDSGAVAAVSADTGLTVFAGSLAWSSLGQVTYPSTYAYPARYHPATELGAGCASPAGESPPAARGFDLRGDHVGPLGDDEVRAALDVVWSSALARALATTLRPRASMVLRYPGYDQYSGTDPREHEWIVLFNAISPD